MPSLQILEHALDRRFVTPARLQAIVDLGAKGKYSKVDPVIGSTAVAADADAALANQQRYIDEAVEKIESVLAGRLLYRQRYRSRQPGSAQHELQLPQWPAEAEALEILGVGAETYRLNDPEKQYLYRDAGFPVATWASKFTSLPLAGTEYDNYRIDFWAGYLMPGDVADWVADRAYITGSSSSVGTTAAALPAFGSWVRPSNPTNKLRFECTTAGDTASSEPTWPTAEPWAKATAYSTGDWTLATNGPIGLWFEATTGGTSGAEDADEPTWPTTAGETVADSTITWTARDELTFAEGPNTLVWTAHFAEELPLTLQKITALLAIEMAKKDVGAECDDKDADACAMRFAKAVRFAA